MFIIHLKKAVGQIVGMSCALNIPEIGKIRLSE
jgi:hypothetical protein